MPKEGTKKEGHEGPPGHGARGATGRPRPEFNHGRVSH